IDQERDARRRGHGIAQPAPQVEVQRVWQRSTAHRLHPRGEPYTIKPTDWGRPSFHESAFARFTRWVNLANLNARNRIGGAFPNGEGPSCDLATRSRLSYTGWRGCS